MLYRSALGTWLKDEDGADSAFVIVDLIRARSFFADRSTTEAAAGVS